jgi:hypothetical protein
MSILARFALFIPKIVWVRDAYPQLCGNRVYSVSCVGLPVGHRDWPHGYGCAQPTGSGAVRDSPAHGVRDDNRYARQDGHTIKPSRRPGITAKDER